MVIEADAIKNRDVMLKHLSSSDFTKNDPTLSSYVHEYSTKAAEAMLVAAGELLAPAHLLPIYVREIPAIYACSASFIMPSVARCLFSCSIHKRSSCRSLS